MRPFTASLAALFCAAIVPATGAAAGHPRAHQRVAAKGHAPRHVAPAASWGSTVYGASLPSVDGSCADPFDPDPIGGPDGVGDGGPGAFLGRCDHPGRRRDGPE